MVPAPSSVHHPQLLLPTIDRLGARLSDKIDVTAVASEWFLSFKRHIDEANVAQLAELMLEDALWRDVLALTWEFRTFIGLAKVTSFLSDILPDAHLFNVELQSEQVKLETPYPDLAWIQGVFRFETKVGLGNGVFRLVPTSTGAWKAHAISTELTDLKGHPEQIGPFREQQPNHGTWPDKRRREIEFVDREPVVVIIGGGQGGLEVAARLKMLDVPTLVLEKQPRIGDQWRKRYEALCLHDPVCECQETMLLPP
jgi:hypothetical protein